MNPCEESMPLITSSVTICDAILTMPLPNGSRSFGYFCTSLVQTATYCSEVDTMYVEQSVPSGELLSFSWQLKLNAHYQ